ncbi:hypothetical protein L7F22_030911 [Adiantum nelumboides]|nr:hypothetical protein [Adiantum nelumboides]
MMPGGETMALQSNSFGLGGFGGFGSMMPGVILPPRYMGPLPPMPMPPRDNVYSNMSGLTLAPSSDLEDKVIDVGQIEESHQPVKAKEDESDSKSSSENMEGASGEENEGAQARPTKKRYHRHTLRQIQEMERFFKECPHPDEKQRQELSRELKLSPRQIKFWFQNKRTKLKVHHERQDNGVLRAENEKLKVENFALRDAVRNVSCPSCGGPATLAEMSYDEQQLRIENMRLREEIDRITAMAAKYIGRQMPPMSLSSARSPTGPAGALDGLHGPLPVVAGGPELGAVSDLAVRPFALSDVEKPLVMELAVASMEELYQVAQAGDPLWVTDPSSCVEVLQHDAYLQRFPRGIGPTPAALKSETSRHTGLVIMNSSSLVEALMDVNQWAEMFPSIVSRVQTIEVLSTGIAGTFDGAIQLMYAEFHVPSPLVPTRENYFLRYSKRVEHLWVVVDVSIDSLRRNTPPSALRCRRRPSGCLIEEMPSGYSKVTWVEHVEADPRGVNSLYQAYVDSGLAFGAVRWLCTLQRQCERMAIVLANNIPSRDPTAFPSPEGRRSMLKLAERMTNSFCAGVSASTAHTWVTLARNGSGADDVRVLIRKSVNDPGRPPGIVLSAATSLWLPLPPSKVFSFLRDERTEWDILSNSGIVEEVFHVAKGQDPGNCVSLLRINPINANQSNMLILQECCTDESCSLVVYAPVDITAMTTVLKGGEPDTVALLPSGFAVLPDGTHNRSSLNMVGTAPSKEVASGGSLLTVTFQILVDHVPTAKLSLNSVATVNNLISNTVACIKEALSKLPADSLA